MDSEKLLGERGRSFRGIDLSGRYTRHLKVAFSATLRSGDGMWMTLLGDALRASERIA